jgi:hypothetical protein
VLAPHEQIALHVFRRELSIDSIREKVAHRVSEYDASPDRENKQQWLQHWFLPTLSHMKIECLSWEELIEAIATNDSRFGSELSKFYSECLKFNRIQEPDLTADRNRAIGAR